MATVKRTLPAELIESDAGETGARKLAFTYDSAEPLSVVLHGSNSFEFARELLREGLERTIPDDVSALPKDGAR